MVNIISREYELSCYMGHFDFLAAVECLVSSSNNKKQVPLPFFISCHCALTQLKDIIQLPTLLPLQHFSSLLASLIAHTHTKSNQIGAI